MPISSSHSHPLLPSPCDVSYSLLRLSWLCCACYMSCTSLASYHQLFLVKLFNSRWMLPCPRSVCATNHLRQFRAVVCDKWALCVRESDVQLGLTGPTPRCYVPRVQVSSQLISRPQEGGCPTRRCSLDPPRFPAPDVTQGIPLLWPLRSLYIGADCWPAHSSFL